MSQVGALSFGFFLSRSHTKGQDNAAEAIHIKLAEVLEALKTIASASIDKSKLRTLTTT